MDFIMPAFIINKKLRQLGLCLLLLSSLSLVHAESFTVESAHITSIGNKYTLMAKIKYPLTLRIVEAINNGIPITFKQQFELIRSHSFFSKYWRWKQTLWSKEIRNELRYLALTQQYLLIDLDTNYQRHFASLDDALKSLGKVDNLILPSKYITDPDNLILQLRSGLDLNALPTPMRPGSLVSAKWQLTSPWVAAQWL